MVHGLRLRVRRTHPFYLGSSHAGPWFLFSTRSSLLATFHVYDSQFWIHVFPHPTFHFIPSTRERKGSQERKGAHSLAMRNPFKLATYRLGPAPSEPTWNHVRAGDARSTRSRAINCRIWMPFFIYLICIQFEKDSRRISQPRLETSSSRARGFFPMY